MVSSQKLKIGKKLFLMLGKKMNEKQKEIKRIKKIINEIKKCNWENGFTQSEIDLTKPFFGYYDCLRHDHIKTNGNNIEKKWKALCKIWTDLEEGKVEDIKSHIGSIFLHEWEIGYRKGTMIILPPGHKDYKIAEKEMRERYIIVNSIENEIDKLFKKLGEENG